MASPLALTIHNYKNNLLRTTNYPGYSGTNTTTNYYDANGNLQSQADAKNQTISYQYDKNNRLISKTYSGSSVPSVVYSYDAVSNMLTIVGDNTDTENDYDDLNRLTGVTDKTYTPDPKVIQYTYYEDGLRESMTDPEGNLIKYTYDAAMRLDIIQKTAVGQTEPEQIADYTYNKLGLRIKLTRGNGSFTGYTYDPTTRWLTKIENLKSDHFTISSFEYTHDKVGNRKTMQLLGGDTVTYEYDNIYQLTSELRTGSTKYSISWTYDEVGNRTHQVRNIQGGGGEGKPDWRDLPGPSTIDYVYNNANQLLEEQITRGNTTRTYKYSYDANGNQVQMIKNFGLPQQEVYNWGYDYENRQISYTDQQTPANNATYTYDAEGRRIAKTVNSVTEKYLSDGANIIADYDGTNVLKSTYVTPFLDQNLLTTKDSSTYYFLQDGLGSVRNLVSSVESVVNSYDYYAFGEILSQTETIPNRYKFTGREWDNESQVYYYHARYYDSYTGRFNQRDPISSDINLYTYCFNNPSVLTDPFGLEARRETMTDTFTWRDALFRQPFSLRITYTFLIDDEKCSIQLDRDPRVRFVILGIEVPELGFDISRSLKGGFKVQASLKIWPKILKTRDTWWFISMQCPKGESAQCLTVDLAFQMMVESSAKIAYSFWVPILRREVSITLKEGKATIAEDIFKSQMTQATKCSCECEEVRKKTNKKLNDIPKLPPHGWYKDQ